MKFFGKGMVWDKDKNKVLCRFVNGEYETQDSIVIDKLKELNFVFDDIDEIKTIKIENKNDVDYESLEYKDLKKAAKEKGINTYKMDRAEIIETLMKVGD